MKKPVSNKQNLYNNGTALDADDLMLDQQYNNQAQSGIIANHFGSGVLADNLRQVILFDSSILSGLLDGKAINTTIQPSDNNYGNQLEIELSDSLVSGKRTIKLFLIGLDFQGNLQYECFTFHKNEKIISTKHYTNIVKIFFNDLIGDPSQSLNLGGKVTIKEAKPLYLSRSCKMVSQDLQPNIFLRDFFVAGGGSLLNLLTTSLPSYNIDALNIAIGYNSLRSIAENDVSTQIGQKFQASSNNIQKITLLLAVSNSVTPSNLIWTGNLIVNLYQLQSSIDCPLDIAPNTAIDFDPSNIPLVQISLTYNDLIAQGITLNETPQPVDFVFSNTPVGSGSIIKNGSYYAIAVKRGGAADTCQIQLATGVDLLDNSVETLFNGSIWVDLPSEDLWFQVFHDAAQVADGQAYDEGQGVIIPKTEINSATGATEDFILNNIQFIRNDVYYGLLEAVTEQSVLIQDQRTGERVYSQQQLVPNISLITANELVDREKASNPLLIGTIADKNGKILAAGETTISAKFHSYGMIGNQCVIKLIDDITDGYRYDIDVLNLVSEITGANGVANVNGLLNAKFIPDTANPNTYYRVADTEFISMIYGDLNGDGVVDDDDLALVSSLVGNDLNSIPSHSAYNSSLSSLTSNKFLTLLQADINGDMIIDASDVALLTAYVNKALPFPNTTSPANRIGTVFNALRFTLEKYVDRADDYTASGTRATSIHSTPDILLDGYSSGNSRFGQNLKTSPLAFNLIKQLNWYDYLVTATSNPKLVAATYSSTTSSSFDCNPSGIQDSHYPIDPIFEPGKNDQFIPSNLIINDGGQLVLPDGEYYPVDLEVETILLEIPAVSFADEKSINLFTDFVADYNGNGKTRLGYQALKYADCSNVLVDDFNQQRVRFSVSLNSFSPEINGVDLIDNTITGVIVDGGIGVSFNASNAILTLNFNNLYEDTILQTQKTRLLITVYLKKAGFKNSPLTISSAKVKNLLGL